jgi:hypothetical protein
LPVHIRAFTRARLTAVAEAGVEDDPGATCCSAEQAAATAASVKTRSLMRSMVSQKVFVAQPFSAAV